MITPNTCTKGFFPVIVATDSFVYLSTNIRTQPYFIPSSASCKRE